MVGALNLQGVEVFQVSGAGSAMSVGPAESPFAWLPPGERELMELLANPEFAQIDAQIRAVGACENPVRLSGETVKTEAGTGRVVDVFSSVDAPGGAIVVRCMNRRRSRCRSCSALYQADAFHLVRAGFVGGKGVPETVQEHPMVFATLTAPSFGPVHRKPDPSRPNDRCRPRRDDPCCVHGRPMGCGARHAPGDVVVGQPMCAACYDHAGHVLFNALATKLWNGFGEALYRRMARVGGVRNNQIRKLLRVEYVRAMEYQARGLVHFHVGLRLDGPEDREAPPSWATSEVLASAVVSAASAVSVSAPESAGFGSHVLRFGSQLDARPIVLDADRGFPAERAAGYFAKYVTKGTEDAHGVDVPITHRSQINLWARTPHVAATMHTAWTLDQQREFAGLGLGRWCHMLGFGGHVLSSTRRFSVGMGVLRQMRADHQAEAAAAGEPVVQVETVTERQWRYAGRGWQTEAISDYAQGVYEDRLEAQALAREAAALESMRGGEAA
ncbi:hypothetical protein KGQ19_45275 [Catenulispora sp. NL8]|uniref:Replication initiation protein n=1 Tax=Catenulispora pinistramenti TaxID=2705254 RepID=A0ABS5L7C6_9ACTN|nr:replication initiator [Catenulispora pinistramenti]MBS2554089.1 hypothetical protein [Catenulispora pinistramenti]